MHLSLEAAGVQRGDLVLTTPFTFAATAEVIRYFDAVPVFVDVEPDTLNMDPRALADTVEDLERSLRGERGQADQYYRWSQSQGPRHRRCQPRARRGAERLSQ